MVDEPHIADAPDSKINMDVQIALCAKEAAHALGISERLLWSMTNAGEIPHVRLGRRVVYPIDLLRNWLETQAKGGKS